MIMLIYNKGKRYFVFNSDCFGVSAIHSTLLESEKSYPYIRINDKVSICANRRSLALLYLRDILSEKEEVNFDCIRDEVMPEVTEKLKRLGQVNDNNLLLETLYIILEDRIYSLTRSGCVVDINSNFAISSSGFEKGIKSYLDRHKDENLVDLVKGVDNMLAIDNEIRRPPYFIVSLDEDKEIERIWL